MNMKINSFSLKQKILLSLLAGALSAFAFAPLFLFPVLFVSFPIFYFLINSNGGVLEKYLIGLLFGLGHFTFGLYWIANALFVDIAQFWFLVPFALLGIPLLLSAVYIGPFAVIVSLAKLEHLKKIVFFASLWVLLEWFRTHFLTGFPWNLIGYSLCFSDVLVQFASVSSIYGLSFIVMITSAMPVLAILDRAKLKATLLAMAIIYSALYGFGAFRIEYEKLEIIKEVKLRLVQANIPQNLRWNQDRILQNINKYIALSSKTMGKMPPDLIIWPEAAIEIPVQLDTDFSYITNKLPSNAYLVTGVLRATDSNIWNSIITVGKSGKVENYYDKIHLVPFGEYIPFRSILPINKITPGSVDISVGKGPELFALNSFPEFAPIICYEVIFPDQPINKDRKWLLNITNDAWYGDSFGPHQHLHQARIRSVEQGVPLVRSAGTGISAITDSFGRVMISLGINQEGLVDLILPSPIAEKTIYVKYGDLVLLPLLLVTFFYSFSHFFFNHKTN